MKESIGMVKTWVLGGNYIEISRVVFLRNEERLAGGKKNYCGSYLVRLHIVANGRGSREPLRQVHTKFSYFMRVKLVDRASTGYNRNLRES